MSELALSPSEAVSFFVEELKTTNILLYGSIADKIDIWKMMAVSVVGEIYETFQDVQETLQTDNELEQIHEISKQITKVIILACLSYA